MDKTKINYFVDIIIFLSFLVTAITGLLIFFFLPAGERNGGVHNTLLELGRHDWGDIHNWAGMIMIIFVIVHIVLHWKWIVLMTKNLFKSKQNQN